jgi:hypothetical protein
MSVGLPASVLHQDGIPSTSVFRAKTKRKSTFRKNPVGFPATHSRIKLELQVLLPTETREGGGGGGDDDTLSQSAVKSAPCRASFFFKHSCLRMLFSTIETKRK